MRSNYEYLKLAMPITRQIYDFMLSMAETLPVSVNLDIDTATRDKFDIGAHQFSSDKNNNKSYDLDGKGDHIDISDDIETKNNFISSTPLKPDNSDYTRERDDKEFHIPGRVKLYHKDIDKVEIINTLKTFNVLIRDHKWKRSDINGKLSKFGFDVDTMHNLLPDEHPKLAEVVKLMLKSAQIQEEETTPEEKQDSEPAEETAPEEKEPETEPDPEPEEKPKEDSAKNEESKKYSKKIMNQIRDKINRNFDEYCEICLGDDYKDNDKFLEIAAFLHKKADIFISNIKELDEQSDEKLILIEQVLDKELKSLKGENGNILGEDE